MGERGSTRYKEMLLQEWFSRAVDVGPLRSTREVLWLFIFGAATSLSGQDSSLFTTTTTPFPPVEGPSPRLRVRAGICVPFRCVGVEDNCFK